MKKITRAGKTFTTVVAGATVLAVFGTGTAVAGGLITSAKIKNNTIKSIDVRNNNLRGLDMLDGTLTGTDVANGSLTGLDVADASLTNQDIGVYFAQIFGPGIVSNSSGGVTVAKVGTGEYEVDFHRNVSQCAFTATVGTATTLVSDGIVTSVADVSGNANAVAVETTNTAGTATDKSFHLIVVC
jgi:hypothetical protein